ncbi:hypothetical protein NX059_004037 [Plenodomus lindquistii]|nr:hypothetical protein NX059_004037 [Plenodomus lindquistii]
MSSRPSSPPDRYPASIHSEYKEKQAKVEGWLAATTSVKGSKTRDDGTVGFLVREFELAAEEVANTGRVAPLAVIRGLEEVLDLRSQLTAWYQRNGESSDVESTESHRYFIQCLQRTHALLNRMPIQRQFPQSSPSPITTLCTYSKTLYAALASLDLSEDIPDNDDTKPAYTAPLKSETLSKKQLLRQGAVRLSESSHVVSEDTLRFYLGDVMGALSILYHLWTDPKRDGIAMMVLARSLLTTTQQVITYLNTEAILAQPDLVKSVMVDLYKVELTAREYGHENGLVVALEELDHAIRDQTSRNTDNTVPVAELSAEQFPDTLSEDQYRDCVRRLLAMIRDADLRLEEKRQDVHASFAPTMYIAQALLGQANRVTAAVLLSMIVDTTHIHFRAAGRSTALHVLVEDKLVAMKDFIAQGVQAPQYPTVTKALVARIDKIASESPDGQAPLYTLFARLENRGRLPHRVVLDEIPCMAVHELLVMFETYSECVPTFLNHCMAVPAMLICYRVLRQLSLLPTISVLEHLLNLLGEKLSLDGRVSRFSSLWNMLLGGKASAKKDKRGTYHVEPVTLYESAPNKLDNSHSFILRWPIGGDLIDDEEYRAKVTPLILSDIHDKDAKAEVQDILKADTLIPASLAVCAGVQGVLDECKKDVPAGFLNYAKIYTLSLHTLSKFARRVEAMAALQGNPLPQWKSTPEDGAYSGLGAISSFLKKVDLLLERNQRKVAMQDPAAKALSQSLQDTWGSQSLEDLMLL